MQLINQIISSAFTGLFTGDVTSSDIVFIVDSSGFSNNPTDVNNWRYLQTFLRDLAARLGQNVRIGVVQYADQARSVYFMSDNVNIIDGIGTIPLLDSNGRNVYSGLQTALLGQFIPQTGDRPNVPNIAVVIMRGPQQQVSMPYPTLIIYFVFFFFFFFFF